MLPPSGLLASRRRGQPGGRTSALSRGIVAVVTVDLGVLPAPLADAVRAARGHRARVAVKPFVSTGPDPLIADWARNVVRSGELDAAIAEVSAADPDLAS